MFWKAQSIKTNKGNMWHTHCPFCFLCPRQTLLADVSTSLLSYMDTSESLSTYIPGSHANRSELQNKMKPLPQACTSSGKLLLLVRSHQAQTKLLGNWSWWKVRSSPANCERPSKQNSGIWVQPITRWLCFSYQSATKCKGQAVIGPPGLLELIP